MNGAHILTFNRLRIDLSDGCPAVEYRIADDHVDSRVLGSAAERSGGIEAPWQRLTPEQLRSRRVGFQKRPLDRNWRPGRSKDRHWLCELALPENVQSDLIIEAGANPKDVQGLMRHSHVQTTLDIYAQFVPESQRRAIERTGAMIQERIAAAREARATGMVN